MKILRLAPRLILGLIGFGIITAGQAGIPMWTFTADPNFPPSLSISPVGTATVRYLITNQSKKTHRLVMQPIAGINQVTTGQGVCSSPFSLGYKQSCTLILQVQGSELVGNVSWGPIVCNQGNFLQCYQPSAVDSLAIIKEEATKLFVNGSKVLNGDGTSWSTAFNNLESALEAADILPGAVEIWVAKGVYKPSKVYAPQGVIGGAYGVDTPKLRTFNLPADTAIYGGFSGKEVRREERNGFFNPTILCGDMTSTCLDPFVPSSSDDRVWHVLMAGSDVPPGTGAKNIKLDTLIVRGGYANGPDSGVLGPNDELLSLAYEHAAGGGLLARYGSTIEINRVSFEQNGSNGLIATVTRILTGQLLVLASGGGGAAAIDPNTLLNVKRSRFINNSATFPGASGGALQSLINAGLIISTSQFEQNLAFRNGGAIRGKDANDIVISSSEFNNNVLQGPVPDASGGALGLINTSLIVVDSSFTQNATTPTGFGGGAIFFHIPFNDGITHGLSVANSKFVNNIAAAFGGGGINVFGILPNPGTQAYITNSIFANNTGGVGGAIYLDSIPTTITRSSFLDNKAQLEGGAIFASNFGNAVFDSPIRTQAQIEECVFLNNKIIGVPAGTNSPLFFFNFIANLFSGGTSSVTAMAPGGGAIAVEFSGDAKISKNVFTNNIALRQSAIEEDYRGGAILVGGTVGVPLPMNLAHACLSFNGFFENRANIDNNVAVYNPTNISGAVTVDICPIPLKSSSMRT